MTYARTSLLVRYATGVSSVSFCHKGLKSSFVMLCDNAVATLNFSCYVDLSDCKYLMVFRDKF